MKGMNQVYQVLYLDSDFVDPRRRHG